MSKHYLYKKHGNNNLYWNYDRTTWVERSEASVYTEAQRIAIDRVEGSDGGRWHEVVAEPVKYGEAPKPIPVYIGDGLCVSAPMSGYYWLKDREGKTRMTYLVKGQLFQRGYMYVYIKEPKWPH